MNDKIIEERIQKENAKIISSTNKNALTNEQRINTSIIPESPKDDKKNEDKKEIEKDFKIGNYLIKRTLGKGTFGKVKLGIYLPKNQKVAIKILDKKKLKEDDDIIRLKREFEMLSQFNHPNVVSVYEIFESFDAYFTVMEYCDGGELFNFIVKNKYLSEEKSAFFYYQLINGLEYIHSLGIVHRDLKPENLLLTHEEILKIIDFGLSNYFKENQLELLETPCGSPCYASPEMLSGNNYDGFKIDIWSSGVILFAMLCGYLPFDHKDNNKLFLKILQCKIKYPKDLSDEATDLLKKILVPDPKKRITIAEIKKHPFYLKGKKNFENNFTICQVSREDTSNSENSFSINYITAGSNSFLNIKHHKTEVKLNKFKDKYYKYFNINLKRKRNYSLQMKVKKNIDFGKEIKKIQKELEEQKNINNKDTNEERKLMYYHSFNLKIIGISAFCESLINRNKEEEQKNIDKKLTKNKNINNINQNKNKLEQNSKNIKKEEIHNKFLNLKHIIKKVKNSKLKDIMSKAKESSSKNNPIIENENEKEQYNNIVLQTQPNNNSQKRKLFNKAFNNNKLNINIKNNIKVLTKKRAQIKINKLFINNNRISILNRFPKNTKLKKSSNNKSNNKSTKAQNLENILNILKQKSIKTDINVVNKQNIFHHHHTTNINNNSQKNYFSNKILKNNRNNEERKNYSTSQKKSKVLDISEIQNKNISKNLHLIERNNLKAKANLQKINTQYKKNSKSKCSADIAMIIEKDEEPLQNNLTIRNKQINREKSESESRTIPSINNKKKRLFKIGLRNNMKFPNKNNNNENSFGYTLKSMNNYDFLNIAKKNKFLNGYININNSVESKDLSQNNISRKRRMDKLLSMNINFNQKLGLDKKLKRNKVNNSNDNFSNRSYNYNYINNFDIIKANNNSNLIYNNNSAMKKIENIKRNNLNFKNILNKTKFKKLNLIEVFGIENINRRDITSISMNFQKQVKSQRNKPNPMNNNQKNVDISKYLNSVRNNENKISNYSYNIGNINPNNTPFYINNIPQISKFKGNQNILRNIKNILSINYIKNKNYNNSIYSHLNKNSISNTTLDNPKINPYLSKNKKSFYQNQAINTINCQNHHLKSNLIMHKNSIYKNKINGNIYRDKSNDSKKFFSSLRKRIKFKSNLINNNNYTYIDNLQNNSLKIREQDNKRIKHNSLIVNYNKNKQFNPNNTIENKNYGHKNNLNFNSINLRKKLNETAKDKKVHKKIKSAKDALFVMKHNKNKSNNFKNLNIEISNSNDVGLYICNTYGNSNIVNYINIVDDKSNTIENNRHAHHKLSNFNIHKKIKPLKK